MCPPPPPPAFTHSLQRFCMLLISLSMSFEGCSPTHPRVLSWGPLTVLGGCSQPRTRLSTMSQQCSIGLRSDEQAGQSIASMPSSQGSPWRHQQRVGEHYRASKLTPIAAENGLTIGSSTSLGRRMYSYVQLPEQISAEH